MKAIGRSLDRGLSEISESYRADLKRARRDRRCAFLDVNRLELELDKKKKRIHSKIGRNILKSVKVCGKNCISVSFKREVSGIRSSLVGLATDAKALARKVVNCAESAREPNLNGSRARTEKRLKSVLEGLKKVRSECKVCPKK